MQRPQVTESWDVSLERPSGLMQFSLLLPCFTYGENKAQGVLDTAWEVQFLAQGHPARSKSNLFSIHRFR